TTSPATNTATKTGEIQPDPVAGNNSAVATVTPVAADTASSKTVDNPAPNLGATVTFTVTATNKGPSNATGVLVSDQLPAGMALVLATPSSGTYNPATGLWTIGALINGANATLVITATVNTTAATTNTATKTFQDQPDPVAGNDSASAAVAGQAADVGITKTVSNGTPDFGSNV